MSCSRFSRLFSTRSSLLSSTSGLRLQRFFSLPNSSKQDQTSFPLSCLGTQRFWRVRWKKLVSSGFFLSGRRLSEFKNGLVSILIRLYISGLPVCRNLKIL